MIRVLCILSALIGLILAAESSHSPEALAGATSNLLRTSGEPPKGSDPIDVQNIVTEASKITISHSDYHGSDAGTPPPGGTAKPKLCIKPPNHNCRYPQHD
jgi:hypothetical protein